MVGQPQTFSMKLKHQFMAIFLYNSKNKKNIREIGVYMENVKFIGAAPAPPPCFQLQLPNGGALSPYPFRGIFLYNSKNKKLHWRDRSLHGEFWIHWSCPCPKPLFSTSVAQWRGSQPPTHLEAYFYTTQRTKKTSLEG